MTDIPKPAVADRNTPVVQKIANSEYSLAQLAELLDAECVGDPERKIGGLATLASAGQGQLSFISGGQYLQALRSTSAAAVIISPDMVGSAPCDCLVTAAPYLSYAKASQLFAPVFSASGSVHPSAVISERATIHASASIAANVVIADDVIIGANSSIGPGTVIGHGSVVGEDCLIHANVTIYHGIYIANRVRIHSTTVIGADGFGYAPSPDRKRGGWVKIAQLGGVRIGDDVELGAGCTIDRGALDDTIIGDRVILDNQVHLAHNVEIGANTAIAGCSGIAGSTKIGSNCTIAGTVSISGHLTIADNVHITGRSMVTKSLTEPGSYSSGEVVQESRLWRKNAVRFLQLDKMAKRLKALEKTKS